VLIPLSLALFPAAVLYPMVAWLKRHRVPDAAAAVLVLVGAIALIAAGLTAVIRPMVDQVEELSDAVQEGITEFDRLLQRLDLGQNLESVDALIETARDWAAQADLAGNALGAGSAVVEGLAGLALLLVALFFYLKDGSRIYHGFTDLLPPGAQHHADAVGSRLWWTVGSYFRGQALVALIDAVFIGLGLWILDVPLALPLATLVFLGGFFPIVGAFASGLVAVLVALAFGGLGKAVAVLVLILLVQQIEGNILQPIIMSRAISLHPLMVIGAVTVGGVLLGILGAFLAVPVAAAIGRCVDYAREQVDGPDRGPANPGPRDEPASVDASPDDAPEVGVSEGSGAHAAPQPEG
jgi:predicted PurR-regulated permease PerM